MATRMENGPPSGRSMRLKMPGSTDFSVECRSSLPQHVQQSGLLFAATVDIGEAAEVEPKLQAIKEVGAVCVNVQMLDHDTSTEEALTRARQVMEAAGRAGDGCRH